MIKNILVVEDEPITLKILCSILEKHNFSFIKATNGNDALIYLTKYEISAIILDISLPDMNGLHILKYIRNHPTLSFIAILIVTENDDRLEAIVALEMGADDYITKPFHQRELIARLNAVLRRTLQVIISSTTLLVFDNLKIDTKKRVVEKEDTVINLSFKEFEILLLLASNPGEVIPRETIMNHIGGLDYNPETRTVDVHISSIRKKLGDANNIKKFIDTVSGVGYRFRKK